MYYKNVYVIDDIFKEIITVPAHYRGTFYIFLSYRYGAGRYYKWLKIQKPDNIF